MSSVKFVRTRRAGWCDSDFAHPGEIRVGDIVRVTTYFPLGEHVRDFGVKPFTRGRSCQWCVLREEAIAARRGLSRLRLRDKQGDLWRVGGDGLLHTRETAPFPIEHVQRKWGPLHVDHQPSDSDTV